jgi:putative nucleotidyltransferase with HDIG domain
MSHPIFLRAESLIGALDARRPAVAAHCRRVAIYAERIAMHYGLGRVATEQIRQGALLHDVGKLLVPSRVLEKPGRLDRREWGTIRLHPELGVELVGDSGFADEVCRIVLFHHERYDGLGYPDARKGSAIDWAVRIVSVADALDAITSPREYRQRLTIDQARALIAREAGGRFCPWVVAGLLSMPAALLEIDERAGKCLFVADGPAVMPPAVGARRWRIEGALESPERYDVGAGEKPRRLPRQARRRAVNARSE